ncbi:3073_t:CDS:10 [Paraglomus brasilianum]|uniref:3073_t:CDS:1 n=1 Tax=Paraglomus brasilianum TaxID=144538 RepID=A0A9N8WM24_9GLOM|nr:3073_t:CDS:10 [Paraglomus brasilianum]
MSNKNNVNGVRVEPKRLQDPSTLESLTSAIQGLSTYVTPYLPSHLSLRKVAGSQTDIYSQFNGGYYGNHGGSGRIGNGINYVHDANLRGHHNTINNMDGTTNGNPKVSHPDNDNDQNTMENMMQLQVQGQIESKKDVILYSGFDEIGEGAGSQSVLCLGYTDGFQIWNITSLDNIQEMVSIKHDREIGCVYYVKIIPAPRETSREDPFKKYRPLAAIVCAPQEDNPSDTYTNNSRSKAVVRLFSLNTCELVAGWSLDLEGTIAGIKCNDRVIVISTAFPPRLYISSTLNLAPLRPSPLTDVAVHPNTRVPVFTLSSRLLAYATTTAPNRVKNERSGVMAFLASGLGSGNAQAEGVGYGDESMFGEEGVYYENGGVWDKGYGDVAKGVAKEVVNGVRILGDYGYQALSSYFLSPPHINSTPPYHSSTQPININSSIDANMTTGGTRPNASPQMSPSNNMFRVGSSESNTNGDVGENGFHGNINDENNGAVVGAIIIRDLIPIPYTTAAGASTNISTVHTHRKHAALTLPVLSHFQPHTNPISQLSFNPSGNLLFTTSMSGQTFHVFEILGRRRPGNRKPIRHLYKLTRGYTNASVGENAVAWNGDSRWCGVATGRGTVHVFGINPFGGPMDVRAHLRGRVSNIDEWHDTTSHSPIIRIKPRTPLPVQDPTDLPAPPVPFANELYTLGSIDSTPSSTIVYGSNHSNLWMQHQNVTTLPFMKRSPSMCLKFLNSNARDGHANIGVKKKSSKSPTPANGIPNAQSRGRTNPSTQTPSLSSSPSSKVPYLSTDSSSSSTKAAPLANINHQQLLTFHPSGILTLHRIRMEGVVIRCDPVSKDDTPKSAVASMGRALVDGAVGVVGGTGYKDGRKDYKGEEIELSVKYDDVAEWKVFRGSDWEEVKIGYETPSNTKSNGTTLSKSEALSRQWLSQAEISTHTTSPMSLPQPLFLTHQFTLQTFKGAKSNEAIKEGRVPDGEKVEVRKEVECVNEPGKVLGGEDISANITSAMNTCLDVSSAILVLPTTTLSFEDAHLVQLAQNMSTITSTTPLDIFNSTMKGSSAPPTKSDGLSEPSANVVNQSPNQSSNRLSESVSSDSTSVTLLAQVPNFNLASDHFANIPHIESSLPVELSAHADDSELDYLGEEGNFFFSPDGDNEIALPGESVLDEE